MTACLIRGRRFFNRKKFSAGRKERQMQGFRIYRDLIGTLCLHSGSNDPKELIKADELTERKSEIVAVIDNKAR